MKILLNFSAAMSGTHKPNQRVMESSPHETSTRKKASINERYSLGGIGEATARHETQNKTIRKQTTRSRRQARGTNSSSVRMQGKVIGRLDGWGRCKGIIGYLSKRTIPNS